MKWTVHSLTETDGRPTYYVKVQIRPPDNYGEQEYEFWFDRESLGIIASRQGPYTHSECATAELFPMETRQYGCRMTIEPNYDYHLNMEHRVGNWSRVQTGLGGYDSIETWTLDVADNETLQHGWYSPDLGFYSKYLDGRKEYVLESVKWPVT